MSTKPETLFYKQIFRELKQVFWTRIENRHGGGIPDVQAPRRKIIKLYDGNKGRELLENGFNYPCSLEFEPSQYNLLLDFLTAKK
jgi:hypothetical protein